MLTNPIPARPPARPQIWYETPLSLRKRANQGRKRGVRPQAPPRPSRRGGVAANAGADVRRGDEGGAARRAEAA